MKLNTGALMETPQEQRPKQEKEHLLQQITADMPESAQQELEDDILVDAIFTWWFHNEQKQDHVELVPQVKLQQSIQQKPSLVVQMETQHEQTLQLAMGSQLQEIIAGCKR